MVVVMVMAVLAPSPVFLEGKAGAVVLTVNVFGKIIAMGFEDHPVAPSKHARHFTSSAIAAGTLAIGPPAVAVLIVKQKFFHLK